MNFHLPRGFRNNIIYNHKSYSFGHNQTSQYYAFFIYTVSLDLRSEEDTEVDIMHKMNKVV